MEFYIEDVETEWDYHNPFDFVYIRMMTGSIRDYPRLLGQAYQ